MLFTPLCTCRTEALVSIPPQTALGNKPMDSARHARVWTWLLLCRTAERDGERNGPLGEGAAQWITNPVLSVPSCDCVCAPKLPLRAFSRPASGRRSDA